jgi:hypothetical protein
MACERILSGQLREDHEESEGKAKSPEEDEESIDLQIGVDGLSDEEVPDRDTTDDSIGDDKDSKHQIPA